MAGSSGSYEARFFEWLSPQVSPAQLSVIYPTVAQIDNYCKRKNLLKKPLLETDDLEALSHVRTIFERDRFFEIIYRKEKRVMVATIRHYCRFIKEITDEKRAAVPEQHPADQPAQPSPENAEKRPEEAPEQKNTNRLRFIEWLRKRGVSSGDIMAILASLKRCSDLVKSQKIIDKEINKEIYYVTSADTMQAIRSFLISDRGFIRANQLKGNQFKTAFDLYSEFFDKQLKEPAAAAAPKPEPVAKPNNTAPATTNSEVDELLAGDEFLPLKLALAKENIRTVEQLKTLKLWAFMNQNNLYSISMRQTVLAKVRQLLEPPAPKDPALLYVLHCGTKVYSGETLAEAFLHFCEDIAGEYPLAFRSLLDTRLGETSNIRLCRTPQNGNCIRMENPTCYISADLTRLSVLAAVDYICLRCKGVQMPIRFIVPGAAVADHTAQTPEEPASQLTRNGTGKPLKKSQTEDTEPTSSGTAQGCEAADSEDIAKAEQLVLDADMNGTTYDELRDNLHSTLAIVKALIQKCKHVVEIKGRLYHEEAFVDWDDGAAQMRTIIEKLMQKNNGYVSAAQLYDFARVEMNLFLNDNDLNDERSVFDIAQHLFEKNGRGKDRYTFTDKAHISKDGETIENTFDVICKFAEEQGGVFREEALAEYLTGIGIKAGNLRNQMRLNREPDFFFYESGVFISAKCMKINDSWKERVDQALKKLLNDADGHIILREIQPVWFESLPALPGQRPWTPLLLQFVLRFYGKEFHVKTIAAMGSQKMDTIHAMLVKEDGPIQNFGDAVIAYLLERGIEQRAFKAEELRQLLVRAGMLHGNEVIWNMPKALAKDERFAWDAKGEDVTVRV